MKKRATRKAAPVAMQTAAEPETLIDPASSRPGSDEVVDEVSRTEITPPSKLEALEAEVVDRLEAIIDSVEANMEPELRRPDPDEPTYGYPARAEELAEIERRYGRPLTGRLGDLPILDRRLLRLYYGLDGQVATPQARIGEIVDIRRERVPEEIRRAVVGLVGTS